MDIELYSSEKGNGYPLVLLHGNGESSEYFKSQIDWFSKTRRVIAVDTRGHGQSPRGTAEFTLKQFAEDLNEFFENRQIETADLLGFSDGANIALLFALRYPHRVRRLILNGADLYTAGVKKSTQLPIEITHRLLALPSRFSNGVKLKREMLGLMINQPNINPSVLSFIKCPSIVIVGTRDMIKRKHSLLIAKSIPACRFVELDGDHFIAAKNSSEFNRTLEAFLNDTE